MLTEEVLLLATLEPEVLIDELLLELDCGGGVGVGAGTSASSGAT